MVRAARRAGFALDEVRAVLAVVAPGELRALLTTLPPAHCRDELVARGAPIDG